MTSTSGLTCRRHALLLEAVDLLLKRRGQPSIKELIRKNGGL
jgi:hypothetical protein